MTASPAKIFPGWPDWLAAVLVTLAIIGLHLFFLFHAGGFWRDEVNVINLAGSHSLSFMARDSFPVLMPLLIKGWAALVLAGSLRGVPEGARVHAAVRQAGEPGHGDLRVRQRHQNGSPIRAGARRAGGSVPRPVPRDEGSALGAAGVTELQPRHRDRQPAGSGARHAGSGAGWRRSARPGDCPFPARAGTGPI